MKRIIIILLVGFCNFTIVLGAPFSQFSDPDPSANNQFGKCVLPLNNGNVVITSPYTDKNGLENCGAVYLFNGSTGKLISALYGPSENCFLGTFYPIKLPNHNFLVYNLNQKSNSKGSVSLCSGTFGLDGIVSERNSLVNIPATNTSDTDRIIVLANGNYLVVLPNWKNSAGAIIWGSCTSPITSAFNEDICIMGMAAKDSIAANIIVLTNGDYIINAPNYDNGIVANVGAVAYCKGDRAMFGTLNSHNSIMGIQANDQIGSGGIYILANGNYVISSPNWNNDGISKAGAVTWCSQNSTTQGWVNSENSLAGSYTYDRIGNGGIYVLDNGNFVVNSPDWDDGRIINAGAVTWCNGNTPSVGGISPINSLVGSNNFDYVGNGGVSGLPNGNYVVCSYLCSFDSLFCCGAVTLCNGSSGQTGRLSKSNSLIGKSGDYIGNGGIVPTNNNKYIVQSYHWRNDSAQIAGALTLCDGSKTSPDVVSKSNSLIGGSIRDSIGHNKFIFFKNGNFLVVSPSWNNRAPKWDLQDTLHVGAITWVDGTIGMSGLISDKNSLIGMKTNSINQTEYKELSDDYILTISRKPVQAGGGAAIVRWSSTYQLTGGINEINSLIYQCGTPQFNIVELTNGNYYIIARQWQECFYKYVHNNLLTWCNGNSWRTGVVDISNSLEPDYYDGFAVMVPLSQGRFILRGNGNYGRLTLFEGTEPTPGAMKTSSAKYYENSLNGYSYKLSLGSGSFHLLGDTAFLVTSLNYNYGAVSLCNLSQMKGVLDSASTTVTGKYYAYNYDERLPIWEDSLTGVHYIPMPGGEVFVYPPFISKSDSSTINSGYIVNVYPNPISSIVNIIIDLKHDANILSQLYNINAVPVKTIYKGALSMGTHSFTTDVSDLAIGTYYLRIKIGDNEYTEIVNIVR